MQQHRLAQEVWVFVVVEYKVMPTESRSLHCANHIDPVICVVCSEWAQDKLKRYPEFLVPWYLLLTMRTVSEGLDVHNRFQYFRAHVLISPTSTQCLAKMGCRWQMKWVSVRSIALASWHILHSSVQSRHDHGSVKCHSSVELKHPKLQNGSRHFEKTIEVALSTGVAEVF